MKKYIFHVNLVEIPYVTPNSGFSLRERDYYYLNRHLYYMHDGPQNDLR